MASSSQGIGEKAFSLPPQPPPHKNHADMAWEPLLDRLYHASIARQVSPACPHMGPGSIVFLGMDHRHTPFQSIARYGHSCENSGGTRHG
jgi:hypothetical protein